MRITIVSETYFPQINGVSRTLGRLVEFLHQQGDEVQLIIPYYAEDNHSGGTRRHHSFPSVRLPFYKEIRLVFCRSVQILRCLETFGPDVVHIATEGPLGRSALKVAQRMPVALVTSYHTNFANYLSYYRCGFLAVPVWRYLRNFHNAGSVTFCPSRSIKELLENENFGNVRIWARGVDTKLFNPERRNARIRRELGVANDDFMMLYVGRIANEKNLDMLLEAFVQAASKKCCLVLVGDGPVRKRLEAKKHPKVIFAGYRQGIELANVYAAADLFVFPSLTETFGNVILEAMASGLPALGFDVPGPRDIITHEKNGRIIYNISANSMRDEMLLMMSHMDKLKQMGEAAREYSLKQNWDSINEAVRETYKQLTKNGALQVDLTA